MTMVLSFPSVFPTVRGVRSWVGGAPFSEHAEPAARHARDPESSQGRAGAVPAQDGGGAFGSGAAALVSLHTVTLA